MANTMDSSIDTEHNFKDNSIQEKMFAKGCDNCPCTNFKLTSQGADKTIPLLDVNDHNLSRGFNITNKDNSELGMSLSYSYLQPSSLTHGYEFRPHGKQYLEDLDTEGMKNITLGCSVELANADFPFGFNYFHTSSITKLRRMLRYRCVRDRKFDHYHIIKDNLRFCRAVCNNDTDTVRKMLISGQNPNCQDKYNRSPLHLASCMGFTDIVKLLLDNGANPNAKDSLGNTPLHLAACTNHVNVITLLLQAGTRVSELDRAGHSPLQLAITKFNLMKRSIMPHPVLKEQVYQVIKMLSEYMKRIEGTGRIDIELLNKFESQVRISDSNKQMESNIQDLLSNLGSLNLEGSL